MCQLSVVWRRSRYVCYLPFRLSGSTPACRVTQAEGCATIEIDRVKSASRPYRMQVMNEALSEARGRGCIGCQTELDPGPNPERNPVGLVQLGKNEPEH